MLLILIRGFGVFLVICPNLDPSPPAKIARYFVIIFFKSLITFYFIHCIDLKNFPYSKYENCNSYRVR